MKKNGKFLVAGVVVALAIIYLVYMGVQESGVYFMTVAELKASPSKVAGEGVRMSGSVIEGSIENKTTELILNFKVKDEDGEDDTFINVTYKGIKPDSFKADVQVILEGKYNPTGNLFKATTLLVKCPSRYEGEVEPENYKPGKKLDLTDKKIELLEGVSNAN